MRENLPPSRKKAEFEPQFESIQPNRRKFEELHSEILHGSPLISSNLKQKIVEHQTSSALNAKLGNQMQKESILPADSQWSNQQHQSNLPLPFSDPKQRKRLELNTSPLLELQYKSKHIEPGEEGPAPTPEAKNWNELLGLQTTKNKQANEKGDGNPPSSRKVMRKIQSVKQMQESKENWLSLQAKQNKIPMDSEYRDLMPKFSPKNEGSQPLPTPVAGSKRFQFKFPPQEVSTLPLKIVKIEDPEKLIAENVVRDEQLKIHICKKDDLKLKEHKVIQVAANRDELAQIKARFIEKGIEVEEITAKPPGGKKLDRAKSSGWGFMNSRNPEVKNSFVKKVVNKQAKK